ncbi:MAG: hypothetical protein Kow0080_05040 [Candidatus Promineifilaceae bacterium]
MGFRKRPYFHFHQLGLRANPFGALVVAEWADVAVLPPVLHSALAQGFAHLQLLGPKGVGKTTTLHKLMALWLENGRSATYEYIPEGQTVYYGTLAGVDAYFLDEMQRLRWRERRRLLKEAAQSGCQLVCASHVDLARWFGRFGLSVITVRLETAVTRDLYAAVLAKRLAAFSLPGETTAGGTAVTFAPSAINWLHATFGTDLREAEYFLYDFFQTLSTPQAITDSILANFWEQTLSTSDNSNHE